MKQARILCVLAGGLVGATLQGGHAEAGLVSLVPHRAVYDLSMVDSGDASDVSNVSGRLVMEFTGSACAGYSSKLRFVTESDDQDGKRQITDSRSSTFESADGKRLEFVNETYNDDTLAEQSRGTASRKSGDVSVNLTKPEAKKFALSHTVVFPTEQMEKILTSAIAGQTFLNLDVYDGSEDGQTVFETAGIIGHVSTAADDVGAEAVVQKAGIAGLRHWPLTLSYFDKAGQGDETPYYTMSFVLYENGVGRKLKIDYGDFALSGTLTKLDLLPPTPCP